MSAKNKKRKKSSKENLFKIILVLILLIAICCVGIYIARLNTDYIENYNFYQYISGRKIEYQGALKITSRGEITELTCIDVNIQLDSTPLYYADIENRVLFPEDMELIIPSQNGQTYKINRFSEIYMNNDIVYLEYRDDIKELPDCFLYDGSNLYFFIDEATLTVDDETYTISPLSYIVAISKASIEIYNKQEDEYQLIETQSNGIVQINDYTINVSLDTLTIGDREQLLLKKFDELQTYSMD